MYHASGGFWAEQFLLGIGAHVNSHSIAGVLSWRAAENTKALNNPLATTESWHGATEFNSAGVKNYPTFAAGMDATIATIMLHPYADLLEDLRLAASAHEIVREIAASPWGTQESDLHNALASVLAKPNWFATSQLFT